MDVIVSMLVSSFDLEQRVYLCQEWDAANSAGLESTKMPLRNRLWSDTDEARQGPEIHVVCNRNSNSSIAGERIFLATPGASTMKVFEGKSSQKFVLSQ